MAASDYLRQTLEHYRQQRQAQLEELRKTEALIAHFEKELGEASTTELTQSGIEFVNLSADIRPPEPRASDVRPDEFYGMTQTQAAKAYLQRMKRAVSIEQIVEALKNGGAQLGGADPKKTLYVSLARNPERQFVIPREGFFGLREFYPNLPKTVSKPKKSGPGRRAARKGHKSKPDRARKQIAPKQQSEKPIKASVSRALSGGQANTLEEIKRSVEKELGRPVATLGVAATLRGKEFVKEGDKYKLAK